MIDVRDKLVIDLYPLTVEMRHGIKPPTATGSRLFIRLRSLHRDPRLALSAYVHCTVEFEAKLERAKKRNRHPARR